MASCLEVAVDDEPRCDFGQVMGSLPAEVSFGLQMQHLDGSIEEPTSAVALCRALGVELHKDRARPDFRSVLAEILYRNLILTDNRRLPLEQQFALADLRGRNVS